MIMKSGFDSNTIQNHTGRVIRDISRLDSEKSKVCPRLHVANSFHPCICLQRTQCCIWNLPLLAVRIGFYSKVLIDWIVSTNRWLFKQFLWNNIRRGIQKQRSCALEIAVMVEHWILETFVGLSDVPRDLADWIKTFCLKNEKRWTIESQEIGGGSLSRVISQNELRCDTETGHRSSTSLKR